MSENKKGIIIYMFIMILTGLVIGAVWIIERKNNEIEELQGIIENTGKPYHMLENSSGYEHNFFEYSGLEFSSYTNKDDFYGLHIIDVDKSFIELYVYCQINKKQCNVEFKDLKCLNDYLEKTSIENTTIIGFNQINCSRYHTIKGNVSNRIY